jgi:hypothetical protein
MTDAASPEPRPGLLLSKVRVRGFRTLIDTYFRPGLVSALVGQPGTGKSNLLAAIRAALDPKAAPLTHADAAREGAPHIRIDVETAEGTGGSLEGEPPATSLIKHGDLPPVLYLPASLRGGRIVDTRGTLPQVELAWGLVDETIGARSDRGELSYPPGSTEAAHGLVHAFETWLEAGLSGMVVLVEEPELFLAPQTQRYLYRTLRRLADQGNQILYSTHSPSFLNVARLDELVFTEHDPAVGTRLSQPDPLQADDEFRAYSEFDATRSELFLARAAILVEGLTERLALPFVFNALGYDPDAEMISIIECGGKPNIPLIARVATTAGIPFVAVHDRDAPRGKKPIQAEHRLNQIIARVAGDNRIELTPDFEGVAGLRGHASRKPARAWHTFADLKRQDVPPPLAAIVAKAVALARRSADEAL